MRSTIDLAVCLDFSLSTMPQSAMMHPDHYSSHYLQDNVAHLAAGVERTMFSNAIWS